MKTTEEIQEAIDEWTKEQVRPRWSPNLRIIGGVREGYFDMRLRECNDLRIRCGLPKLTSKDYVRDYVKDYEP